VLRDQTFDDFLTAYAKSEDEIRAIWVRIIKAHAPFTVTSPRLLLTEHWTD